MAANREENNIGKKKTQLIALGRVRRIANMDAIFFGALAADVCCGCFEYLEQCCCIVLYLFWNIYHCKKPEHIPVSNLRLFRHVLSILHLRLSLGKSIRANLIT